jgi:hypothetical protein
VHIHPRGYSRSASQETPFLSMEPESLLPLSQYPSNAFCPKKDELDIPWCFQLITNVTTVDINKYVSV